MEVLGMTNVEVVEEKGGVQLLKGVYRWCVKKGDWMSPFFSSESLARSVFAEQVEFKG